VEHSAVAQLTAESYQWLRVLAVVAAPLPLIVSLLADDVESSSPRPSLADLGLSLLALWVIVEALVVTSLGLASRLFLPDLLLAEAAVFTAGVVMLRRRRGAAVRRLVGAVRARVAEIAEWSFTDRWLVSLVSGMAILLCLQELGLPTDNYDSLAYQLPRVVEWYQQGTILMQPAQWAGWINSYPYAWSTVLFLMVAPVGHDQLILLPNLAAWLLLGLAVYGLARLAGGYRTAGLAAAAFAMLMPLSVINVHSAHNDLPLGALFLSSVYWSIRGWREQRPSSALLALAAAGMMLGTKTSGVGYFALLGGLWTCLALMALRERGFDRSLFTALCCRPVLAALSLASLGVLGASWYISNALLTGNPLGFFEVTLFGRVVWKGAVTRLFVAQTSLLGNFRLADWRHWSLLLDAVRDYPGWPGMMLLGGVVFVPRAWSRRREERQTIVLVLALCVASLYLYVAGPWSAKDSTEPDITVWMGQHMRYSFPFWGLLAAAVGAVIPVRASALVAVAGMAAALDGLWHSALYSEISPRRATLVFVGGAALASLASSALVRRAARRLGARVRSFARPRRLATAVTAVLLVSIVVLAVSWATSDSRRRRQAIQASWYGGVGRFIMTELDPGTRIGFWETNQMHLLYAGDLGRRLRYLALDTQRSREAMLAYVLSQSVDVVAVGPKFWTDDQSPVWSWLEDQPTAFVRVHGGDIGRDVFVYRLLRDALPHRP